ncbi:MAG TPA: IS1380 family transposase [Patescibacteria group bacterium]|nr:IS1380 family transposase [Patescibacteria group bacterium]
MWAALGADIKGCAQHIPFNPQGEAMIRQTVLPFKLERTDDTLTAHGGLALLAEYTHALGLQALADRVLPQPRSHRGYAPSVFVETIILLLQAGGRTLEDLRELTREEALLTLLGQEAIPDPDTVGDWLRRMGDPQTGQAGLHGLGQVRDALTARLLRRDGVTEYTLDVDATLIEAEKREAQWSYQGVKGYMPLLGFLFETPICLVDEFREGNVSPGTGHLAFYRQCQARLPHGKRIGAYRADSASYQAELLNTLEADGVYFAITADQDAAVTGLIQGLPEAAWQEPIPGCGYEVADTVHTMNKSTHAFRLIVKRARRRQPDLLDQSGYVYHAVASNWPSEVKTAHAVLCWHNQRGQAENFHKELKSGFGLERMPCGDVGANAVFFRLGVLAYNLFIGFRRLACPAAWAAHTKRRSAGDSSRWPGASSVMRDR